MSDINKPRNFIQDVIESKKNKNIYHTMYKIQEKPLNFLKMTSTSPHSVRVVSIDSPTRFFLQLSEDEPDQLWNIGYFNTKQIELIEEGKELNNAYEVGDFVAAKSDEIWYRAVVIKFDKTKGCWLVYFIDYGDFAEVEIGEIMPLHPSLRNKSVSLLRCCLREYVDFIDKPEVFDEKDKDLIEKAFNSALSIQAQFYEPFSTVDSPICGFLHPVDIVVEWRESDFHLLSSSNKTLRQIEPVENYTNGHGSKYPINGNGGMPMTNGRNGGLANGGPRNIYY